MFKEFLINTEGTTGIEYGVFASLIGAVIVPSAIYVSSAINGIFATIINMF